jgi:hypothetical protein
MARIHRRSSRVVSHTLRGNQKLEKTTTIFLPWQLATVILAFQQFLNYFKISFFIYWPLILEPGTEQNNYMTACMYLSPR